jgi:hypothetical protein
MKQAPTVLLFPFISIPEPRNCENSVQPARSFSRVTAAFLPQRKAVSGSRPADTPKTSLNLDAAFPSNRGIPAPEESGIQVQNRNPTLDFRKASKNT